MTCNFGVFSLGGLCLPFVWMRLAWMIGMIVMCASRDVCTLGSEGFTCVACMDWVATSGRSSVCVTPSSCSLPAGRGQCFFQFPFSRSLGSLCKRMGPWQPRQDGDEEKGSVVEKEDGQNHTGTDTKVLVYIYIYIYIYYILLVIL